jgi:hypothetical protein
MVENMRNGKKVLANYMVRTENGEMAIMMPQGPGI